MALSNQGKIKCFVFILVFLLIGTASLAWLLMSFSSFVRDRISDQVILTDDNQPALERLIESPDAKYVISYYFFNVTNLADYNDSKKRSKFKPKLEEIGPFVYDVVKTNKIIASNRSMITYQPTRRFIFNRDKSVADIADTHLVIPNVPIYIGYDFISKTISNTTVPWLFTKYLGLAHEDAFIRDTADKILFTGSHRKVFDIIKMIFDITKHDSSKWPLEDDNFAIMYKRNDTWHPKYDGNLTVSRGYGPGQTLDDLLVVKARDAKERLVYWNDDPSTCNQLNGTVGVEYAPLLDIPAELYTYQNDLCRSLRFKKFESHVSIKGIDTVGYQIDPDDFNSKLESNQCFCLDPSRIFCQTDGLVDLETCQLPLIYGSQPHFLGGSQSLIDQWPELSRADAKHNASRFFVEPTTGVTLDGVSSFQINVLVPSVGTKYNILAFAKDAPMLIPLIRIHEVGIILDAPAKQLRQSLTMISWLHLGIIIGAVVFACAALLTLFFIYSSIQRQRRHILNEVPSERTLLTTPSCSRRSSLDKHQASTINDNPDQ